MRQSQHYGRNLAHCHSARHQLTGNNMLCEMQGRQMQCLGGPHKEQQHNCPPPANISRQIAHLTQVSPSSL